MDYPHSIPGVGLRDGKFVDEDIATGTAGSLIPSAWSNAITDEILSTIAAAGLNPDEENLTQLLQAIRAISTQQAGIAVQKNSTAIAMAGGTADALTGDFAPAITSLTNGLTVYVRATLENTSASPTFKADDMPAKTIVKGAAAPLAGGDIAGAGHWLELQYDATLDRWILQNPATGVAAIGGRLIGVKVFDVPGTYTYTPSTGITSLIVEVCGGGGGGGATSAPPASQSSAGGGGGGGAYASSRLISGFSSGVTVTVGVGGTGGGGGNPGGSGGTSSFGALISAVGGGGSANGGSQASIVGGGGAPGGIRPTSGNLLNLSGGVGMYGVSCLAGAVIGVAGCGGSSKFGNPIRFNAGANVDGEPGSGSGPGVGGGGGNSVAGGSARRGGDGAAGIVIVWEYA